MTLALFLNCLLLFVFAGNDAKAQTAAESAIRYEIDLTDAMNHYLTITAEFPADKKSTELMMAVWTPGSYLVREYARHLDSIEITSGGKPLPFEKTRKNRWRIQTVGLANFKVKYRVYCNELSVRTNWVGKQFAMINGAPTFLTRPDRLGQKHIVRLKLPDGWTRSATSLKQTGDTPHTFVAEDFDELVDSPIVAGNVNVYPFTVGGVEHQLVNVGESGYWDGTKATTDLKRVVEAHQKMWKVIPYERYLFLNMIVESGGGLEHDNSTLILTSRWSFRDERRYKSWLSLASHEFFHTWNVRRLRPKPLAKYDYENEVYTDGLWIAEGITSYYQDLALVRAGLISRNDFLSKLSRNVESVQRTEGRKVQSLKDASFDAWIKFYRPDDNASNTRISYYSKGAVVAFLLDAKIRKLTKGKKSLDDVLRTMYSRYSKSGFTSDQFRKTASNVAGTNLSNWFASVIDSTDELDYSDIDSIGIVVPNAKARASSEKQKPPPRKGEKDLAKSQETSGKNSPKKKGKRTKKTGDASESNSKSEKPKIAATAETESSPKVTPVSKPTPKAKPWLGISTSESGGRVSISSVKPNSPGFDVGLNIGDEIIALNGFRITRSVDSRLAQYEVGDEIELLVARRGKLMTVRVEIGILKTESWRLRFVAKPSKSQKSQLDQWLTMSKESERRDSAEK